METEIITRCQNGQTEEFGKLYDLYIKDVYRFIFFKTGHKETAEDLTSTTFIKALEGIGHYQSAKGSFKSWLFSIARNTIIDHHRTHRQTVDIDALFSLSDDALIEENVDRELRLSDVLKEIAKLAPHEQDIVMLRVWQDLPFHEISAILGKSEASLKVAFHRTVKKIASRMAVVSLLFLLYFYHLLP